MINLCGHWQMHEPRLRELVDRFNAGGETDVRARVNARRVESLDAMGAAGGASVAGSGERPYEVVGGVAIIPIIGVMIDRADAYDQAYGFVGAEQIIAAMREAQADAAVRSIRFEIDSPGGLASAGGSVARAISFCSKPTYGHILSLGASAAYRAASQCTRISAERDAQVGSIGTYTVLVDNTKLQDEVGVKLTLVSSGKYKGLGADGKTDDLLIEDVRREITELNDLFVADVKDGRGISEQKARDLADGRLWIASLAREKGLIDVVEREPELGQVAAASPSTPSAKPLNNWSAAPEKGDSGPNIGDSMTVEQFKAFAAEHPEAVSEFVAKGKAAGLADGKNEARSEALARMSALRAACNGNDALAADLFLAGKTAEDAQFAIAAAAREKTAADAKLAEKDGKLAEQAREIEQLKAAAALAPKGSGAVATGATAGNAGNGGAGSAVGQPDARTDPKAAAGWEWDNDAAKREGFSSKENYVAFREAELRGAHRSYGK